VTLEEFLAVGETMTIGSYNFDAEAIKAFARRYDPQPFHMDEAAAEASVFGGLCASGWHTAAAWMKCNVATLSTAEWRGGGPAPQFGPSPGFSNLKWLKPVFAGETVTYTRTVTGHRPLARRPGWHLVTILADGTDSTGDKVISFESAVLVKVG
jgi:acyl dehydratase